MRKIAILAISCLLGMTAQSQTLNVNVGNVTYAFPSSQTGDMVYENGNTLTICGKAFPISEITNMIVDQTEVNDNTVLVSYDNSMAKVVVAGNIAKYISADVKGGHVALVASPSLQQSVTYTLTGTSSNGSFYMSGEYACRVVLNGVSLNNPDSAAINIQDGKKIDIELATGTSNSLSDGLTSVTDDGSDTHKAVFYVEGHSSWSGSGSLNIKGNVRHGFFSDEYTQFESNLGSVTVEQAKSDGFHVNQYFQMQGGTLNITAVGDGIDVGAKKSDKENNGNLMLEGGNLTIVTSGDATRALKCDNDLIVSGGTIDAKTLGNPVYDSSEVDLSSCAAAKCDGKFTMTAGTLRLTSTGEGGKGLNATGEVEVSGGDLVVVTTGATYEYTSELDSKPHGVKSDANITLSGGNVLVCASADGGTAFKTSVNVFTNGATMMGVGGKATTGSASSTHNSKKYSNVKVTGGSTLSYDGVSFVIPDIYNNSSAKVIVSSAAM